MSILAVCLDAAGTLIHPREPVGQTYQRLAAAHGIGLTSKQLGQGFAREFPRMPPLAFEYSNKAHLHQQEFDWWRTLVGRVVRGVDGPGGDSPLPTGFSDFFDELYTHYAQAHAWSLYPEVLGVLDALKSLGLKQLVVSNFDQRLFPVLEGLGVMERVDGVLCSSAAGSAKPEASIFVQALARLDSAPGQTVHVGDNPVADLQGARDAGLHALLVVRGAFTASGTHQIEDLEAVVDFCTRARS